MHSVRLETTKFYLDRRADHLPSDRGRRLKPHRGQRFSVTVDLPVGDNLIHFYFVILCVVHTYSVPSSVDYF